MMLGPQALAQAPEENKPALQKKIAVLQLEALGMDAEPVARLESLFRMELQRLSGRQLPSRARIARAIRRSRKLRRCSGHNRCLAAIGKKIGVDVVVSGSVGALGNSYILNIKAVDVKTGKQLQRIETPPLRGKPDELIYDIRVAAYRLLAPEALQGGIMVLTDLVGAKVTLDGKHIGTTPMTKAVGGLELGKHELRVEAKGYEPFTEKVEVRFQKATRVVVRLERVKKAGGKAAAPVLVYKKRPAPKRWYQNKWVWIGAGVGAAVFGGIIGYNLAKDPVIDCSTDMTACTNM